MATKPRLPNISVPVIGPDGRMTPEWYRALSQFTQSGAFSLTVGAAGAAAALPATPTGYITVYVSVGGESVPKLQPFYNAP